MKRNKEKRWMTLDQAGKLFAATSSKYDTKVFRIACELQEEVDAELLKKVLKDTLVLFPLYRSILKRGIFWYYLELSDIEPSVTEEKNPPCSPIYNKDEKKLLFEVTYYHRRINLEVFHALTDGTGAIDFMKVLVQNYLKEKYPHILKDAPLVEYDASNAEKLDDSFDRHYDHTRKNKSSKLVRAYQFHGSHFTEKRIQIVEGQLSVKKVVDLAHTYHTTVTTFLIANLLCAIHDTVPDRQRKKPVVISIPVNLRNYFVSKSARNFFGLVEIGYLFSEKKDYFEDVIAFVDQKLKEELTQEKIEGRMNRMSSMEHHPIARILPLPFKNFFIRVAIEVTDVGSTASISNLGKIVMPKEYAPYIHLFDSFIWNNKLQACISSYEDQMVISFSSSFVSTDVQKKFFRSFTEREIPVTIVTTPMEDDL